MKPRPDYQRHLTATVTAYDVVTLADRVCRKHYVSTNVALVQKVINTACASSRGTVASLDLDGLQRAYFELKLLEVGAKLTYERVKHQGVALSTPPALYDVSHNELEDLVECATALGHGTDTIQSILQMARPDLTTEKQTLSGLDVTGMEVVYKQVVRLLVNPIEFIRANPLDFHPSNLRDNDND